MTRLQRKMLLFQEFLCSTALLMVGLLFSGSTSFAAESSLARVIDQAQTKMVKIYGAGGFRGMEGYQSGFLISAEGHVLTALSYVLDTDRITVTLNDGRRYDAKLLGGDPRLEVAVLKIEATNLPHFDLAKAVRLTAGTRILALSNLFNVAMGDEPASVQSGTVSVLTRLEGRRGVFETPYHGPIYVLDVATNNPGASGGALVTFRGELAGLLGKELRNSLNNTWLSYAVPIDQLRQSVDEIEAGKFNSLKDLPPEKKAAHPMDPSLLGINLVPDVLERTPAYVDQVRPGTAAARAGLQPDDLILLVGNHLTQSCKALQKEMEMIDRADAVKITILRGQELVEVTLQAGPDDK
ncbi:MAG: trypsin-like peptidase domain-containing protein [Thermoguttaceae bacterium]|jgi:serine protease Do